MAIRPSRRKLRRNLIGTALVSVGGLAFAVVAHPLWDRILGTLLFLGTGALVVLGRHRMSNRNPILVLTDDGLRHRTLGLIRWDDIGALTISHVAHGPRLEIEMVGRSRLFISEATLPFSAELLRDMIEERAGRTWPH